MIELQNVKKSFKQGKVHLEILKGIDLTVNQGEYIALMGPSGSGKSTLLGVMSGIDSVTSGSVKINSQDIAHMSESNLAKFRNENIGIVFQSFNLISSLSALENVMTPLYVSKNKSEIVERSKKMLHLVDLSSRLKHKPSEMSGGQQQRVAIARALVTNPKILFADEPTGNLDSKTGAQILELFKKLQHELGLTLVVATHDVNISNQADRVVTIKDGLIVN